VGGLDTILMSMWVSHSSFPDFQFSLSAKLPIFLEMLYKLILSDILESQIWISINYQRYLIE
jgi:hypothetical protein